MPREGGGGYGQLSADTRHHGVAISELCVRKCGMAKWKLRVASGKWEMASGKAEDGEWKMRHLAPSGVAFNAFLGVN